VIVATIDAGRHIHPREQAKARHAEEGGRHLFDLQVDPLKVVPRQTVGLLEVAAQDLLSTGTETGRNRFAFE